MPELNAREKIVVTNPEPPVKQGPAPAPTPQPEPRKEEPATTPDPVQPDPQTTPPPVEPAAPQEHKLLVESQPPGATIFLDGKETGQKTPADLVLPASESHQLELRMEGFQPVTAMPAELAMDKWTISLKPLAVAQTDNPQPQIPPPEIPKPDVPATAAPGKITYSGEFPVSIYNNKKLVLNTAGAKSAELPAGSYKLLLVSTGKAFIRQNVKVDVKPGGVVTIPGPAMSQFGLTATPSNCKIYIDTVLIDVAPIFNYPVQAGNHHIRAHWEKQNKEKSVFITISPDKPISLRAIADETAIDIFEVSSQ